MNNSRKTLSVCLVVKNESKQIVDCLEHITILADEIIIVDTGSTDGTQQIVKEWAKRKNAINSVKVIDVGNRFHDSDGDFDFGKAKTFSFSCATKDYVMWLDATDRVQEQIILKKRFIECSENKKIAITLPTKTSNIHSFNRLRIAPRGECSMVGKIHEFMWIDNIENITKIHINVPIVNIKSKRDLNRNLRILKKEWNIAPNSRLAFYIGNTLYGLKNYLESIFWFKKRVFDFDSDLNKSEEYYKSLECIVDCILKIYKTKNAKENGVKLDECYGFCNKMISMYPDRYEGYYYMGLYFMEKRNFEEALNNFKKYTSCKIPVDIKLWLDPMIYKNKIYLRKIEECKIAKKLETPLIPEEIIDYENFSMRL